MKKLGFYLAIVISAVVIWFTVCSIFAILLGPTEYFSYNVGRWCATPYVILFVIGIVILLKGKLKRLILKEGRENNHSIGAGIAFLCIAFVLGGVSIWSQYESHRAAEKMLKAYQHTISQDDSIRIEDTTNISTVFDDYEFFLDDLYIFKYPSLLQQVNIENAPHMRLKLEGEKEYLTVSQWDYGWDNISAWDEKFISQMESFTGNEAVISEIDKLEINGMKLIKIVKSMSVAGEPSKIVSYATTHQGSLLIISHLFQEGYGLDSDKIINGFELK